MDAETFPNVKEAVAYLKSKGWKVEKSSMYDHLKQGRLRAGDGGAYLAKDLDKYAKLFLKKLDPTTMKPINSEKLQAKKASAEVRKLEAQAQHWELRAKIEAGKYVGRDQFERELAMRAALFKSDLEYFCMTTAPEIIRFVAGDIVKEAELTAYLLEKTGDFLHRYSEKREWEVSGNFPEAGDDGGDLADGEDLADDDDDPGEIGATLE